MRSSLTALREFLSRVIAEHWEPDQRKVEVMRQCLQRDRIVESVMT
ncbi:MAG TPA: hypothetical protein VG649_17735 [Candidatus Angelobacter sp.]|nr:hypothetical protein [Candidatus Angelobacter sp.]